MGEPVVELRGIGKRYRLGEHLGGATDLKEAMAGRFWQLMGRAPARREDFWALRDVDLTVAAGESLGVVGRNGAGKSTLLKIVAGVTTPTEGVSRTRGRIGSLLEIGTGFNDELTGRENTFLSGAILGMRRREVAARLDEIVAFAGLDDFVDTPVKRYSSGMYLRLAFAVAAHLEADILLVDEVLAVGDAEFRRKCLAKMSEVESTGRTVLFASHNHEALIELCSKAVWFDEGRVAASGPAATTVREYLSTTAAPGRTVDLPVGDGNERATLRAAAVLDRAAAPRSVFSMGEEVIVEVEVDVAESSPAVDIGIVVERSSGAVLLDENLAGSADDGLARTGRHRVRLHLPSVLTPAEYVLSVWLGDAYEDIAFHERIVTFVVDGNDADRSERLIALGAPWTTEWLVP